MKKILIGALLGFTSLSTLANEGSFSGEFLLGSTTQEVEGDDGDDISFGLRGAYNINKNVGVELSYQDYGEADWSYIDGFGDTINEKVATDSLNIGIKGVLPLQNGFSLNARLGIAFWNVDVDITDSSLPGLTFSGSDSGNDIYYGIGGQYAVNDKFNIGLEYTLAEFGVSPDGDLDGISADLELSTLALTAGLNF